MFKRFPYLSLLIAVVVAALAAVPAMATDEVPAPPAPPAPGQSAPAPTGGSCTDTSKPSARISTSAPKAARSKLTVRGKASDAHGCGAAGRGSVARVTVSVQRKRGKRCQSMSSKGKLGSAKSCASPKWLSAHGASSWSFVMPKSLPEGTYVAHVRAVDSAGNVGSQRTLHVKLK